MSHEDISPKPVDRAPTAERIQQAQNRVLALVGIKPEDPILKDYRGTDSLPKKTGDFFTFKSGRKIVISVEEGVEEVAGQTGLYRWILFVDENPIADKVVQKKVFYFDADGGLHYNEEDGSVPLTRMSQQKLEEGIRIDWARREIGADAASQENIQELEELLDILERAQ